MPPATTAWRNRIVGHGDVPPSELVANPRNWRTHPRTQRAALSGALDEVGWVQQVIVNRTTGLLVDGHLRVEVAAARGEPSVPVTYVELDEREEALVLASLDPLSAMAGSDKERLADLLQDVTAEAPDLDALLRDLLGTGKAGLTDPDDVPPAPAETYVRPGDLWLLGEHRLMCGSCVEPEDVDRLLGGGTPRLLVTDPPYGVQLRSDVA